MGGGGEHTALQQGFLRKFAQPLSGPFLIFQNMLDKLVKSLFSVTASQLSFDLPVGFFFLLTQTFLSSFTSLVLRYSVLV